MTINRYAPRLLVESVDVKTQAYARLFGEYGEGVVSRVVDYHLTNGGISRFVKFRVIYSEILNKPLSEKNFSPYVMSFLISLSMRWLRLPG